MQSPLRLLKKYLYSDMNLPILSSQKLELLVPCFTNITLRMNYPQSCECELLM